MKECTRSEHVYMAKLAEQAERYADMCEHMLSVTRMKEALTVEERNLLSVAYKNVIGGHRASWRIIGTIENKNQSSGEDSERKLKMVTEYKVAIEKDLDKTCHEILKCIDDDLLNIVGLDLESKVFYHKMKGDYQRYLAEFKVDEDKTAASDASLVAYKDATKAAEELPSTHPIRLGLALNYSVFLYEIMKTPEEACKLAKKAFDGAISDLDSLNEESYKDSTLIMQLLRDNLTLWTSDTDNAEDYREEEQDAN